MRRGMMATKKKGGPARCRAAGAPPSLRRSALRTGDTCLCRDWVTAQAWVSYVAPGQRDPCGTGERWRGWSSGVEDGGRASRHPACG